MEPLGQILKDMVGPQADRCLFCNANVEIFAMFSPDNSQQWGAPEGKKRLVFYGVCGKCAEGDRAELAERAEKILWHEKVSGNAAFKKIGQQGLNRAGTQIQCRYEGTPDE